MAGAGLTRVKVALVLREVAKVEGIDVTDDEVDDEIEKQVMAYKDDDKARERLESDAYRDYTKFRMRNEKVIDFLRETMVK